jgi:heme exporter protein C
MSLKKDWWKILGVVLFAYAIIAGLLIPLKAGIQHVKKIDSDAPGELRLEVKGYNTHFEEGQEMGVLRAYLKLDSVNYVQAKEVAVLSENDLDLSFIVPSKTPKLEKTGILGLVLDNKKDGFAYLPDAVYYEFEEHDLKTQWIEQPSDLHVNTAMSFPYRKIIEETIRNIYFHVNLWMAMFILFIAAFIQCIQYLRTNKPIYDKRAFSLTLIGLLFGFLGIATGSVWAKFTWGAFWTNDIKLNMAAVSMMIYLAYFVLRQSIADLDRRARITAAYNIFALIAIIPLIYVLPRMVDSLHPGSGGNPAFGSDDLDNSMRMVFYPAIIGLTLLGVWMASLVLRILKLEDQKMME